VVLTHRSPLAALPSLCRMMETVAVAHCVDGSFEKHRFGRFVQMLAEQCMFAPLRYREAHPERSSRIFDCLYEDLTADPIALVRRIYERFNLECSNEFESRMQRYLTNEGRRGSGRCQYTLEEYGLDAAMLERRYAPYVASYARGYS
jgi:hypothetical protein